jgi:rubrerythrin
MWMCTNCHHLEITTEKPEHCPVCGATADKITQYEAPGIKGAKTLKDIQEGFVAESKAHMRNLAFALKAEEEGYPQIAKLFRVIAESEGIHTFHHLDILNAVANTQENLQAAFERENLAKQAYPAFIKDAEEEDNTRVAMMFSYHRDVEREHAKLYEKAMQHMLGSEDTKYFVCSVCGYVSDGIIPDQCPICGAPKEAFKLVN